MAGSTTYPGSVDNKTALQDGIDIIQADDINDAYVPIDAIETFLGGIGSSKTQSWTTDLLEALANFKAPNCKKASGSTITVEPGVVVIKNSGQSNRMLRRTTANITVSASNLDTGAMADDTYYYLYAVADTAATTFTVKFSASASAPTGLTNFELIGWFFNQSAGALDITLDFVGNVRTNGRFAPNVIVRTDTTSDTINDTSYGTDLTNAEIRFYSSGRPLLILGHFESNAANYMNNDCAFIVDIDGADQSASECRAAESTAGSGGARLVFLTTGVAAGTHTITIQAKVAGSDDQVTLKHVIVIEL